MRAYRLVEWQRPPVLADVPISDPGPGEVLVRVGGASLCHSDVHLLDIPQGALPFDVPFTIGHENAGWVHTCGPGVTTLDPGDPVLVYGPWGCGSCRPCRYGSENFCENLRSIGTFGGGLGRDGGVAEFLLVPSARHLVPLPSLAPADAAPLADAGLTPYSAVRRVLDHLRPGSSTLVIGVGGLGHLAIQILAALTATKIVAADVSDLKIDLARSVGADHAVRSDAPDVAARVDEATQGRGVDAVFDFVGTDATMALAAAAVRPRGRVTVVGLGGGSLPFRFVAEPWARTFAASFATSYWGSIPELMELVDLAERGLVKAETERFTLDQAPAALEALQKGRLRGRAVVVP